MHRRTLEVRTGGGSHRPRLPTGSMNIGFLYPRDLWEVGDSPFEVLTLAWCPSVEEGYLKDLHGQPVAMDSDP